MLKIFRIVLISTILLFSSSFGFSIFPDSPNGKIIYVGGLGSGNYSSIGEAIQIADDFDIIFVYNGLYLEHSLIIDKKISIIGEEAIKTVIEGDITKDIFKID